MNKIQKFRKVAKLSQKDLADMLNITQGAVGHYEAGIRIPSVSTARNIVLAFNEIGVQCTLDDLFPTHNE
ncbi:helix-turn-helix transcriptional regulator [Phocoenobacter skyensis]|uniref:Helix-turn-helix transcriptional regulator n=1 Tax=Phocoenobacter skyensis TaxID=97481 RepID=A0ABT9JIA5_9PAST|nr:helix-turn-helix transcriptional regulator [Pasteurella skyensis]MDP8078358.1 helix-turn-helix transcriptional regulator [Pasteurella skyensis]MDP8084550.1 helix-turn-helix transcriptional regulator [Pasteurella skyensis]